MPLSNREFEGADRGASAPIVQCRGLTPLLPGNQLFRLRRPQLTSVAANQALTITEPEWIQLTCTHTEGGLQIICRGLPNTTYELEWSLNLKTWAPLQSLSPTDAQGEVLLVLPESPENRFYRVRRR